jgi:hypothetical protein
MADFKAQVEGLTTLEIGTTPSTPEFETFLADGVKDVIERVLKFKPQLAPNFAKTTAMTDATGVDLGGAQVLGVVRENGTATEYVAAEPLNFNQRFIANDTTSLNYKSKFNPGWYEKDGKVFTIPDAGASGSSANITHVSYFSPSNDDVSIDNFPDKYEHLVALYAAIKTVDVNVSALTIPNDLSIDIEVPVTISAPSFTAEEASLQNDVVTFTKSLSGIAPTYNFNNTFLGLTALQDFLTFSSYIKKAPLIYDVDQPLSIPFATLSYDGPISTLVQYSDPNFSKLLDKIALLTPPVYTKPILTTTSWSFKSSPDIDSLTPPNPAALAVYNTDYSTVGDPPIPWNPGTDAATGADEGDDVTVAYNEASGQQLDWEVFNDALADDDYEKATAELTKISQMVTLRQDTFSKEMEVYKEKVARVDAKIGDADKNWSMALARFGADLGKYQADVGNIYTTWTHDFNRESTKFTQENTHIMSQLAQEVTQTLNAYNAEKAVYDAAVTAVTKDIENAYNLAVKNAELEDNLELQNAINAAKKEVDQWQTALKRYELSMTKYTTDVSANLERYKVDLNKELDTWKTRMNHLLGKYKDDVTQANKIFDAENAVYQASLQKDMAELSATVEATIQKMDLSTNLDMTNKAQKLQGEIQTYNSEMDKYVAELQSYEKRVSTRVQEYTTEVQNKQMDYTWLKEQYDRLKGEYENTFMIMAPQAPQGAPR